MRLRDEVIDLGFRVFDATRLHRAAAPFARGLGAILMFHRVRENVAGQFAPNRGLEITPRFLDALLVHLRHRDFAIVSLDEAVSALADDRPRQPFVALTFDDGTRDTMQVALPILARHQAPFTVFVTTGFADRTARMWWLELEEAIGVLDRVDIDIGADHIDLAARTPQEKAEAFAVVYRHLRAGDETQLLQICRMLCHRAELEPSAIVDEACLNWRGVKLLAEHPLVTIGAHTCSHPRLAKLLPETARSELNESKNLLERQLGRDVRHLAYPVGDPTSAGMREFAMARDLGYASAVTTRPGMLFPEHGQHLTALPRLSINGAHQSIAAFDVLLSGAPFFLVNGGRRLSVA